MSLCAERSEKICFWLRPEAAACLCVSVATKGGKMAFAPIGVEEYVKPHMQSNPDEDPVDLLERLRMCVSEALGGARCHCGEPIWVIGSTFVGHMCFTCITGEADPSEDYEIDEVLETRRASDPEWPW